MPLSEHPLRQRLQQEFHARPPRPLTEPTRIRHLAFMHGGVAAEVERERIVALCAQPGWRVSLVSDAYCIIERGACCLRWEWHTEFSSYTWFEPAALGDAQRFAGIDGVAEWMQQVPGELIVSLSIDHCADGTMTPEAAVAGIAPEGQQIVVSSIVDGWASLITDFQLREGRTHFVLIDRGMTQRQAGRTVQRIWEIETYRMLALLGLPSAKELSPWLRQSEQELAALMDRIGQARDADDEQRILDRLTTLAAEVEHSLARTAFRFGAARAYFAIVMQRIGELRETRVPGYPPLREFMDRRLVPPMNTCNAMATRQEELSQRIARNSQLLRTRVDIARERQNQALLAQMNHRSRQQLQLQETVEGLSVVAITYYGSQLVNYVAKGIEAFGIHTYHDAATALAIPLIAGGVWWGLRRMRRTVVGPARDK